MKRAVVVGSGAGGAMAARELAGAFDVTVFEAGQEFRPFGPDLGRVERLRSSGLFLDPRMIRLLFPAMRVRMASDRMALVCGVATGGTTTLATGNALRCDEALLRMGIDLSREFEALYEELPISTGHERRWRPATRELFSACDQLGLSPTVTPKLVDYSRCTRCGRCVLGCPTGAKWDSREHLRQAVAGGAQLLAGAKVERLTLDHSGTAPGRATGVVVRRGRRTEFVSADLVVLAAGGFGTPAILGRSGLATEDRLFVDPVLCVAAPADGVRLDEEVPMPFFVEGDGYIISPYFDYLSFCFERSWKRPRHDIVSLMIKLADNEAGSVDGRGRVTKSLSAGDKRRLETATGACMEILARFGARRDSVFLGALNAGHPGGMLPLTGTEREPLHSDGLPANVYVADASLLPQSLGKPPILTIMAVAKRVAGLCAERFG
jgi:choline dehydrogenase-like flavoprotein